MGIPLKGLSSSKYIKRNNIKDTTDYRCPKFDNRFILLDLILFSEPDTTGFRRDMDTRILLGDQRGSGFRHRRDSRPNTLTRTQNPPLNVHGAEHREGC